MAKRIKDNYHVDHILDAAKLALKQVGYTNASKVIDFVQKDPDNNGEKALQALDVQGMHTYVSLICSSTSQFWFDFLGCISLITTYDISPGASFGLHKACEPPGYVFSVFRLDENVEIYLGDVFLSSTLFVYLHFDVNTGLTSFFRVRVGSDYKAQHQGR